MRSQRHVLEVHELADRPITFGTLTITFADGTYPAGFGVTSFVTGDSTGEVSAFTRSADAVDQTALATAVAADINALTGFTASATLGVVTIAFAAPNTTASVVGTKVSLD